MESRQFRDETEWSLSDSMFQKICSNWGEFSVDLFASRLNTKLTRFFSWQPDPDAEIIDAFTTSWENELVYAFPPFCLVGRVLQKIIQDNCKGVIVVPNWPTKSWFALLTRLMVGNSLIIPVTGKILYLPGKDMVHPLAGNLKLLCCFVEAANVY